MPRILTKGITALATLVVASALVPMGVAHAAPAKTSKAGAKTAGKAGSVINVTDQNFDREVLKSDKPVLVDFWATWCPPCRMQGPIVEEVAGELGAKVKVVKLDTDANPNTAAKYDIRSIPALFVFKNGKVVEQVVGLRPKDQLLGLLKKHI